MNWFEKIMPILTTKEMADMKAKVKEARSKVTIWPESKEVFNVFQICPYEQTRVVILGQDPYPNQHAHGIAFSSKQPFEHIPKSLANIFKEIHEELYPQEPYESCFQSSDLTDWVKQGVLLMNTVLTVENNKPDSHANTGWEFFTEKVMQLLNDHPNNLVFLLWGSKAKAYRSYITNDRHLILEAAHPSPMSASTGFFGCGHFIKVNKFLKDEFFRPVEQMLEPELNSSKIAEITGKFLQNKGIVTNFEQVVSAAKYYGIRFPKFLEQLAPEITNNYQINFKTVIHEK